MSSRAHPSSPQDPKKVLYVITKSNWGGAQRYVYDLATSAKDAGYLPTVISGTPGELTRRLEASGVPVESIQTMKRDIGFKSEFLSYKALLKRVREMRPDVIHANSSKAGFFAVLAGRVCGIPHIIFTAHGWAFNEARPGWQKVIFWFVHYVTILLSHKTVCVSDAAKRDTRSMPFISNRIVVIHNGVSGNALLGREEARLKLWPESKKTMWVGTIAELHPTKQLDVAIEAFAKLAKSFPEVGYVVMGEGEKRLALERKIEALGLTDSVRLCGHVENASSYLSALDIFLLPSRSEGLAYVLLEAGLAKLAVVASNVGGIPEVITNNQTGILVPSGDIEAVANSLSILVRDSTVREKLGASLYERVYTEFSLEGMANATFALYGN
ncbi:MAG: hypothetical protein JWN64_766 [Parcubacteria group bacterium]|nr:hypothetical protein [Parcubacteria group bacterium]